ncbi:hypothetical protein EYR41_004187 [Orbilia oligospora]|uniref:Nephrocystin 3-like N-terminal domain-containing protein n=1 Tax=Orbilia oligospora TaxID=2813651 RepID=A0A8H2E4C6_ORBOL|nr:hypothetical protein EYR41_004187 [Orbilia oligospora]
MAALESQLIGDEKYSFEIRLVPDCIDPENCQVATIKVTPSTTKAPAFLARETPSFHLKGKLIIIDVNFYDLTQLYPVPEPDETKFDIVALPGLNSHAYGSWAHTESEDNTTTIAQHWIDDYVNILLTELNKARRGKEERRRPLVLMSHSFGGTIVAHAYVTASVHERYNEIHQSVAGIFFFGVPFSGIKLDDVRSMLEDIDEEELSNQCEGIVQHGLELLKYIDYEAGRVTLTTQTFINQISDNQIYIYSFYETHKQKAVARYTNRPFPVDILNSACPRFDDKDLDKIPYARSAAFDSFAQQFDPKCHPDTRKELLSQIENWAKGSDRKGIFWLNGVAGTGKSTISRTVAQRFSRSSKVGSNVNNNSISEKSETIYLGASFFFKRGENERDNASKLFTTIAVQLSQELPELVPYIKHAIQEEPDIAAKSLGRQFELLVFDPLQKFSQRSSSGTSRSGIRA